MSESLLNCYREIEASSRRMLEAARQAQWNEIREIEQVCALQIRELKWKSRTLTLEAKDSAEKMQIMLRILKMDAEIRDLAEPWIDSIDAMYQASDKAMLH